MSELPFAVMSLDRFVDSVSTTTLRRRSDQKEAAYTLLLGAGFSFPLIPTATQMVQRDIPWWLRRQEMNPRPTGSFTDAPKADDELDAYAKRLWANVHKQCGKTFELSDKDGLPTSGGDNIGAAYQAIMCGQASSGLSTPAMQRDYIRAVVKRMGRHLNWAHICLASILHAQRDPRFTRPFCHTVFTTNFDALLQRALQIVNQLYFMTDRPEQGIAPPDDSSDDAIHLIYTHGNVHRYFLANSQADLKGLQEKNAPALAQYFERHGVIVMGYGGCPDTTMRALKQCNRFDGNLYWCDMHDPATAKAGALREDVVEFLGKDRNNRFYVQLPPGGADAAMLALHRGLGLGHWPSVLFDPLEGLIEELSGVELPATRCRT